MRFNYGLKFSKISKRFLPKNYAKPFLFDEVWADSKICCYKCYLKEADFSSTIQREENYTPPSFLPCSSESFPNLLILVLSGEK